MFFLISLVAVYNCFGSNLQSRAIRPINAFPHYLARTSFSTLSSQKFSTLSSQKHYYLFHTIQTETLSFQHQPETCFQTLSSQKHIISHTIQTETYLDAFPHLARNIIFSTLNIFPHYLARYFQTLSSQKNIQIHYLARKILSSQKHIQMLFNYSVSKGWSTASPRGGAPRD